jgi:hypothetical protein
MAMVILGCGSYYDSLIWIFDKIFFLQNKDFKSKGAIIHLREQN